MHSEYGNVFLTIAILATIIYTVLALYEINSSKQINTSEKIMWTIGFLFINTITAIVYFIAGRKRITDQHRSALNN